MQIVIDIDEEVYKDIKNGKIYTSIYDVQMISVVAVQQGTPLPKGHGVLKDADAIYTEYMNEPRDGRSLMDIFRFAPIVLKADRE